MAISAATIWRVRIGGSDTLCAGLFDSSVVGAGTDYTDQDTAQLALTDLASVSPWTTVNSAVGGFTAAMVGNGIYISGGTNFTAGRYIIVSRIDNNNITVDRACGATGASSGALGKIGGALASPLAPGSSNLFTVAAGNAVLIRGQGSNSPADIDYTLGLANTNQGGGLAYIGYNGRPKFGHAGMIWQYSSAGTITWEHIYFAQTVGTYLDGGVVSGTVSLPATLYDCVMDQAGFDSRQITNVSVDRCSFINTGSQVAGTRSAYGQNSVTGRMAAVKNSLFKDLRFTAITVAAGQIPIDGNVIQNCQGDGIVLTSETWGNGYGGVTNNTVHGVAGHGISLPGASTCLVTDNMVTGITGAGKFGINIVGVSSAAMLQSAARIARNNLYGNTNNSNLVLQGSNTTIDPQYANAPVDLTPTNMALRSIGGVGSL